ncbi:MAG: hypothetical protein NXI23_11975 [Bacteroidetes bacterium]|jgi:hypothetical protein|nr:hypothetical protein [Bacteroidota bacterium]MDF1866242.1 hypothetical protein [Saprospiraceae bacterium]
MKKKLLKGILSLAFIFGIFSLNAQTAFTATPDEEHSIFIIPGKVIDLNEYRGSVTKYVWRNHAKDRLKINNIEIGETQKTEIIHISSFRNKSHAMEFINHMKSSFPDFLHMNMTEAYYAVSESNYNAILRNQGLENYEAFFEENYHMK